MLIQLTNRCQMRCPHCLQDSTPDSEDFITDEVFYKTLWVARVLGVRVIVLSGGEPTEHPKWFEYCQSVSKAGFIFSVASNGIRWFGDKKLEWLVEKTSKLRGYAGFQVYSNPKWYRLHEETLTKYNERKSRYESLGVNLDTTDIRQMDDLGRAKTCPEAMKEVESGKYDMACFFGHLCAAQITNSAQFFYQMESCGHFCSPSVYVDGTVRLSESHLCPSVASVMTDRPAEVWRKIFHSRPCMSCFLAKRLLTRKEEMYVKAREILQLGEFAKKQD